MRTATRFALLVGVGIATLWHQAAWGDVGNLPIITFPLQVKCTTPECKKIDKKELDYAFRSAMIEAGVRPLNRDGSDIMAKLKRQDCETSDDCLSELARLSAQLYGLYVQLDIDKDNNVIVTGRIVRDDGKITRETSSVRIPKGSETLKAVAPVAFNRFCVQLNLAGISTSRPVEPVKPPVVVKEIVVVKAPEVVGKPDPLGVTRPPDPPPVVVEKSKALPIGLMAGGGAAAVIGSVLWGVGAGEAGALKVTDGAVTSGNYVPGAGSKVSGSQTKQILGGVVLGLGVASAVTGLVLLLTQDAAEEKSEQKLSFGFAPTANGGVAVVQGSF